MPEMVINYFRFVAREVREIMASMGVRSIAELIGQTQYLKPAPKGRPSGSSRLDLSPLLSTEGLPWRRRSSAPSRGIRPSTRGCWPSRWWPTCRPPSRTAAAASGSYEVKNFNRSIGARVSGEIARRWGNYGMAAMRRSRVKLTGSVGQSFGVWNAGGLHMILEGDANDYVGKGMAAGKLVLQAAARRRASSRSDTVIMGNTCLYGATGGELYAAGQVGERFAVRNSGAVAVVEGAGDHCCEYMTGGVVCVLGPTGFNFGAGFTGGFAYVLDMDRDFVDRYNHELIDIHRITPRACRRSCCICST